MEQQLVDMNRILKEETELFEKIFALEESKTGAIIGQHGKQLEMISLEQEGLLSRVSALESSRSRTIDSYRQRIHMKHENPTLRDIIATMDASSGPQMEARGRNLKRLMDKLSRLQETNNKLISDNMEYYNILMSGIRRDRSVETGYGSDGKEEEKMRNSILFNQTA